MRRDHSETPSRTFGFAALLALAAAALPGCRSEVEPAARPFTALVYRVPSSLDPHDEGLSLLGNAYESLVVLDGELRLRPALAVSWQNPQARTWLFHLRPGVKFHRGRSLTAADVVFSFERVLSDPSLEAAYYLADVESVRALDPLTVELRVRRASPTLLNHLASVAIIPAGATAESLGQSSDGSGPYRIVAWSPGERLEVVAMPGHSNGEPLVQRGIFLERSPEAAARALLANEAEIGSLGAAAVPAALSRSTRYRLFARESLHLRYLGFDLARAETPFVAGRSNPFLDPRVRRAIHLAVDRRRLASSPGGTARAAYQLVPRAIFGFAPHLAGFPPDRGAAASLLAEAGLADGLTATLHTRELHRFPAEEVARQLSTLGLGLSVEVLSEQAYFEAFAERRLSLWLDNWGCTTGDASELFRSAMHSFVPEQGLGLLNESGWSDPNLDRAIEAGIALHDPTRRRQALESLMTTVMAEALWVPLFVEQEQWAVAADWEWEPSLDLSVRLADVRRPSSPR